ncbi:MAG: SPFH domain-containing protein [Planctomycetota bacterium]
MRNFTTLSIAVIIFLVLAFYMFFFQVRFDEYAVVTTWEKAVAPEYGEDGELVEAGSLITEPGILPKLPWPIQKVYRYPTKVQLLEQELQQFQTADNNAVVLQTYVTWRIDDPYRFFVTLRKLDEARTRLGTQMSTLVSEFSRYRFDQMVNVDPEQLVLEDIEDQATAQLRETIERLDYGIKIEQVGVRRLLLDETTTSKVFDRMRSTRQRLAASAEQEGKSRATEIRAEAEQVKGQILSFAEAEATRIRAEGVRDATASYDVFKENPELAIFLSKVETLKQMLPGSTLVLDANSLQFFDLITTPTDADRPADGAGE